MRGQIGPGAGLVAEIMRLAVAAVQPRKRTEQTGVALRRHQRVELAKAGMSKSTTWRGAP